jgi:TolB-like protein/DNA-binding winged helix-turn-helix (wHTH) protein/Flp pilus assembly protein TadD
MSKPENHLYEFGSFRLDEAERLLLRDGVPVPLEPKVFDTLLQLIRNRGRLLEKGELMDRVWSDAAVEEGSLTRNISTLRRALGDGENGLRYIETVPRRGYRFVAGVRDLGGGRPAAVQGDARAAAESPAGGRCANLRRCRSVAAAAVAGLAVVAAVVAGAYLTRGGKPPIASVAVLPFANAGDDPNVEYLSDGIAENLINNLSQLPQLKVIARSSAFEFKGREVDPEEVARAVGAEAIVTGKIVQRGEDLRISVELVNTGDGTQMWGEQYQRRASDLQAVQAEISRAIAENLRLRLTGVQERRLSKRATENARAYQLYLTGMFHMRRGNLDGYRNALDYLQQAVTLDPNFALAFAGMPTVYSNLAATGSLHPAEALARSKAAAQKALELDGTLAEAHNGLAVIRRQEWDWQGAESSIKRAIELNPNLAAAHHNYAIYLAITGRTAEALEENRRAQELDPFKLSFKGTEAYFLLSARMYDEAQQVFQNVIRMQPDYALAHAGLGHTYAAKGVYAEAVSEFRAAGSLYGGVACGQIDLGYAHALSGRRGEALAILSKLKGGKEYVSPARLAMLYAALGDKEAAFRSLERAYAERDSQLQKLQVDPRYHGLRSDPRFADLLRRMGLAPHSYPAG